MPKRSSKKPGPDPGEFASRVVGRTISLSGDNIRLLDAALTSSLKTSPRALRTHIPLMRKRALPSQSSLVRRLTAIRMQSLTRGPLTIR